LTVETTSQHAAELMHRMGHSSMRAALIYQHAMEERSRELADRLDELLRRERGRRVVARPLHDRPNRLSRPGS
jgi:hypothetical protein